jgi:hypothetical protein
MANQLNGVIHTIKQTQVVSDKFQKREFVVETKEQYPQFIKLEFTQDKCTLLDKYQVGQEVSVDYNLRGNLAKTNDNAFVSLQAWKIESVNNNPAF